MYIIFIAMYFIAILSFFAVATQFIAYLFFVQEVTGCPSCS